MEIRKTVQFMCTGNDAKHEVEITQEDLNQIAIKKVLSLYSHVEKAEVVRTVISYD